MDWKYVIELCDNSVFEKFKQIYGIEVPEDIQELVRQANAGTPSKFNLKDEDGSEKVFGALLSYNETDDDNVYTAMEIQHSKRYIPFAVDPFGNYFYENILFGDIVWVNHEKDETKHIADSMNEMLMALY